MYSSLIQFITVMFQFKFYQKEIFIFEEGTIFSEEFLLIQNDYCENEIVNLGYCEVSELVSNGNG